MQDEYPRDEKLENKTNIETLEYTDLWRMEMVW